MSGAFDQRTRDHAGRQANNTIFGDAITSARTPDILVQFQYGISDYDVSVDSSGGASITSADSTLKMTATGVQSGSVTSRRPVRYQPGFDGYAYFTALFESNAGAGVQIGLQDDDDGYFLEHSNGIFKAVRRHGGDDESVDLATGSELRVRGGSISDHAVDLGSINIYRISYGWLGVAPIMFEVYGGLMQGWLPVHTFGVFNQSEVPSSNQPSLPMVAKVWGSSPSSAARLFTCSWSAGRAGTTGALPSDRSFGITGSKSGISTEVPILSISSATTFQSKKNHVLSQLMFLTFSVDGTKSATIRLRRNSTLTGASFTAVDASSSVISVDTAATAVSGGTLILPIVAGKVDSDKLFLESLKIFIFPGDTITVTAQSALATDVGVSIRYSDLF